MLTEKELLLHEFVYKSVLPVILLTPVNEPFETQILQEIPVAKGGVNYAYMTVKYNTITRSGYDVERISYIAATVRQRRLFTLVATVSSERRNKMDLELNAIRASFRVGDAGVVKASE